MEHILFLILGVLVGFVGTLIGAGGGFLLSPVFIFLYPSLPPSHITAMSLLAVSVNSLSGSAGYAWRKQVHWKSVALYALAGIPGVYLGVLLNKVTKREVFEALFGFFMIAMSAYIISRSFKKPKYVTDKHEHFWNKKSIFLGGFFSFFVGILSSLLGIGGGIVHVPLLSEVLKYPLHLAAGTSHAILAITSFVAVVQHFRAGDYDPFNPMLIYLCIGLVFGAQLGAHYSKKIATKIILRILGVALVLAGLRLLMSIFL